MTVRGRRPCRAKSNHIGEVTINGSEMGHDNSIGNLRCKKKRHPDEK